MCGNHFNVPGACGNGLLDSILKRDPTTLATWFAGKVGIEYKSKLWLLLLKVL